MEYIHAIILIFATILGGAILRTVSPFLQKKQEQERTYEALRWIPESSLTEEQKVFIQRMGEPLHFRKYYTFTAIFGFIGVFVLSLATLVAFMETMPKDNVPDAAVMLYALSQFITAYGGVGIINRMQSSSNTEVEQSNKRIVAEILAKKTPP